MLADQETRVSESEVVHPKEQAPETVGELQDVAREVADKIQADVARAKTSHARVFEALDRAGVESAVKNEISTRHEKEMDALSGKAQDDIAREAHEQAPSSVSLWEKARQWCAKNADLIAEMKQKKADGSITKEYGKGVVNAKFKGCAENPQVCANTYLERRKATGRPLPSEDQLQRVLAALAEGKKMTTGADIVLMEELTQETAYTDYQTRKEKGNATLGAEGILADMYAELDIGEAPEVSVESFDAAREAVQAELRGSVEKGYITEKEASLILDTVGKFGAAMMASFEGKRFVGGELMTKNALTKRAYETMRDNARKIAYQTKMDKRVFAGSDHGTRHICEGCTHCSEQMMNSMRGLESVDFKPQDEVLIRQIIIDHDIGYTTDAAQAKGGHEASKDHPCAGCDFVESNKDYYVEMYGKEGYEIIRDVVLNHSYPQSEYTSARPEAAADEITFNRDLIRSVVSTVDAMGVTSETKAMDMFRHAESVDILQDVKLYAETHDGKVDDETLGEFKKKMHQLVDRWLAEKPPRVSAERAVGYRSAIDNQFNPVTVEITLGQFTGVVRDMKLQKRPSGEVVPEIQMDVSRLAALVGDNFGDKTALNGFVKAMEDFGLTKDRLQHLAGTVRALRAETDPVKRAELLQALTFETDRATFKIGERETTGLADEREEELRLITERFEQFERETVRSNIRDIFGRLRETKAEKRTTSHALDAGDACRVLFDLDDEEAARFDQLRARLVEEIQDDAKLALIQSEVNRYRSKNEKHHLKKYEK